MDFLQLKSSVVGGADLKPEPRNKLLMETLKQGQNTQFSWIKEEDVEVSEYATYEEFYNRVMAQAAEDDKRREQDNG